MRIKISGRCLVVVVVDIGFVEDKYIIYISVTVGCFTCFLPPQGLHHSLLLLMILPIPTFQMQRNPALAKQHLDRMDPKMIESLGGRQKVLELMKSGGAGAGGNPEAQAAAMAAMLGGGAGGLPGMGSMPGMGGAGMADMMKMMGGAGGSGGGMPDMAEMMKMMRGMGGAGGLPPQGGKGRRR